MCISNYGTRMKYDGIDLMQPIDPSDDYGNYGNVLGKYETSSWEIGRLFSTKRNVWTVRYYC